MKKWLSVLALAIIVLVPILAFAQQNGTNPTPPGSGGGAGGASQYITITNPLSCNDASCLLQKIIQIAATFATPVCVAMILWGGYQFLVSGGAPDKITAARNTILYAAIGLGIALIAYSLPSLIRDILSQ